MANKNTTSESSIEEYFKTQCKYRGMKTIKMIPTFEAGIPDRQVLWKGVSGFAEIKAPGEKPRKRQVLYLKALEEAGFYVGVVDSKESALSWIHGFMSHGLLPKHCALCGKPTPDGICRPPEPPESRDLTDGKKPRKPNISTGPL